MKAASSSRSISRQPSPRQYPRRHLPQPHLPYSRPWCACQCRITNLQLKMTTTRISLSLLRLWFPVRVLRHPHPPGSLVRSRLSASKALPNPRLLAPLPPCRGSTAYFTLEQARRRAPLIYSTADREDGCPANLYSSARNQSTGVFQTSAQSRPPSCETALSRSSTNASASPHPFAALQNLASFMPLSSPFSWSGMRALSSEGSSTEEILNKGEKEQKNGFVSKDRQLARLRERMATEGGVIGAQARAMPVTVPPCRRCVDRVVAP
ncbi:hypothetical protein BJV78DRAFT_245605 [Lactifluus subvellereus]|nr:hypothetical protein BJV78DRAFT_245605 [Lactifluus subvellereus]